MDEELIDLMSGPRDTYLCGNQFTIADTTETRSSTHEFLPRQGPERRRCLCL